MKFITRYRRYLLLGLVDLLFFIFFSPNQSSWLLLPGFALLIVTFYAFLKLVIKLISQFIRVSPVLSRKIVVFGTFVFGVIIALQSLGQLTPRDIITVVPLIAVLYLYVSYFTMKRQK